MKVGAIPFYLGRNGLQVCLVSTTRDPSNFTIPKGNLKDGEQWSKGAMRELYEEAGITARILMPHTPLIIPDKDIPSEGVIFFWSEVISIAKKWPEKKFRKRVFCSDERKPDVKLSRTGTEVFNEILDLNLGARASQNSQNLDITDWIMSNLDKLRIRADLDYRSRSSLGLR